MFGDLPGENKNKIQLNKKFIFGSCLDINPEKRPEINQLLITFYMGFLSDIKSKDKKEQILIKK